MAKYFDSKDCRLEFNLPLWVEFLFDKSYNWPEPSGTSNDYQYQGKTIKGGPYWAFKLKSGEQEYSWQVKKLDIANALNGILEGGNRRVAVMKMSGTGDDKKHYLCLSNPSGSLMTCIPNREIPKHFVDFVGVSQNGGGVAPQPPQPQQQSPAVIPLARKTMAECIREARLAWAAAVLETSRWRFSDEVKSAQLETEAQIIFDNVCKAMGECLGMTASSIYNKQ